ncbi:hypothetical protein EWM64_g10977 [Hericium alpestre]|uniref:Copper transporter n=1 Tax=Hericium alpestre TaxID=135208 RepID=A0A4Y9ZE32_9AGAM|nr:hypothetical protein EWM64_g10977 [Hericium alpestre]
MPIVQPSSDEADEAHGHKGVIVKFGGFATPSHAAVDMNGASTNEDTPVRTQPMVIHHHNMHMHGFNPRAPFWARVHRSLMLLGPWEGRAVAFVLGCGIGVLLRMVWVLTVLTYRTIRGTSREEPEVIYHQIVFEDAEDISVAPPQYTDEKVALAAAEDNNKSAEGEQPRV